MKRGKEEGSTSRWTLASAVGAVRASWANACRGPVPVAAPGELQGMGCWGRAVVFGLSSVVGE